MSGRSGPWGPAPLRLDRLRQGLGTLADRLLDRSVRLAVTGLSNSGKTVFITALVHQLLVGARLPFLEAAAQGRLIGARLVPPADQDLPAFPYRDFVRSLTEGTPAWPRPTDRISGLRLAIRFRPAGLLQRQLAAVGTLRLDIIDYPGEWLLDLPLLALSFADWSAQVLAAYAAEPRATLARDWLSFLDGLDPAAPAEPAAVDRGAALYTEFLHRCRAAEAGLSLVQPGRFTMPGDLAGSPLLVFCPVPPVDAPPGSLRAVMAERFEAYKEQVVRRFYREQFSRFDRQVVLLDLLKTLNRGEDSFADMQAALEAVMRSFSHGRSGPLARLFRPRIDKVLFAATKADHVATNQHNNLRLLLDRMIAEAAREVRLSGVETGTLALASVKATETVITDHDGRKLSCVKGVPQGRDREVILFPGEIPESLPTSEDWAMGRFNFLSFRPPPVPDAAHRGLPHIRLDQALEFLVGDKLA